MGSTIQLIQLTLRIEREAERQYLPATVFRDDLTNGKTAGLSKWANRVKGNLSLLYRQQQCECA